MKGFKQKIWILQVTLLFIFLFGFQAYAQIGNMQISGMYINDGKTILIVSGGTLLTQASGRELHYEISKNPFSIKGDFIHGDPEKHSLSTKTKVKFRQTKEMETKGELLIDTTGEGYLLEFVADMDMRTGKMHNMTGLFGPDIPCSIGRLGRGLIIESSEDDSLTFKIDRKMGYVYVKGTGVLRLPDGRSFAFPVQ